jgi:hypothetical protein
MKSTHAQQRIKQEALRWNGRVDAVDDNHMNMITGQTPTDRHTPPQNLTSQIMTPTHFNRSTLQHIHTSTHNTLQHKLICTSTLVFNTSIHTSTHFKTSTHFNTSTLQDNVINTLQHKLICTSTLVFNTSIHTSTHPSTLQDINALQHIHTSRHQHTSTH